MIHNVLVDKYNRVFSYLRLSITDLCNFSCKYCMPANIYMKSKFYLSLDEIYNLVSAFSELGVTKVRLTGGEPTIRKDFFDIGDIISSFSNIKSLVFTTNGYRLFDIVDKLSDIGFTGVNISMDTLNVKKFNIITGKNYFHRVLKGIYRSLNLGLNIKINIVLSNFFSLEDFESFYSFIKYKNVSIRFISQMNTNLIKNNYINVVAPLYILSFLKNNNWYLDDSNVCSDGPAHTYSNKYYLGKIGIINPYSNIFCVNCNRLRVSSIGGLYLCLFGNKVYCLRHLLQSSKQKRCLISFIYKIVKIKERSHYLQDGKSGVIKSFVSIGG